MMVMKQNKLLGDKDYFLLPRSVSAVCLSLCLSVSQLYPHSALHAEDQNIGFQDADVQTISDRDFICPSGLKI